MKSETSVSPRITHLLDTSAVIAYLAQEAGADRVQQVRTTASLSFITLTELYYVTWRQHDQVLAERAVQDVLTWKLPILCPDQRMSLSAGYLKGRYKLGIADSFIAATALAVGAILVTTDPDFTVLEPDLNVLLLGERA